MENPVTSILEISMFYAVSRCLHVIVDLNIADALGDHPRSAAELAASIGADAGTLNRALRILASYGIFEARNGSYAHTASSRLLRSDHPQSMRSYVRLVGDDLDWKIFEQLRHSMLTGKPAIERVAPQGFWAYLAEHPEYSEVFDHAMTGRAFGIIAGILANYDFSAFKNIADIGGGRGHLLTAVLGATPKATGVLFDQPHVVKQFVDTTYGRIRIEGGDFFTSAFPVCDAYLVMQVIHDWADPEALAILSAIRRAAPAHAKLLLVEGIVPDDSKPTWIKMLDLFMMVLFGARERTRREYEELLAAAKFRLDRAIDIGLNTSILEASVI